MPVWQSTTLAGHDSLPSRDFEHIAPRSTFGQPESDIHSQPQVRTGGQLHASLHSGQHLARQSLAFIHSPRSGLGVNHIRCCTQVNIWLARVCHSFTAPGQDWGSITCIVAPRSTFGQPESAIHSQPQVKTGGQSHASLHPGQHSASQSLPFSHSPRSRLGVNHMHRYTQVNIRPARV